MAEPEPQRLSVADHTLIHILGWWATGWPAEGPNDAMMEGCLQDALPRVSRDIPLVAGLAKAAAELLAAETVGDRHLALLRIRQAMAAWHMKRAGDAHAALQAFVAQQEGEDA